MEKISSILPTSNRVKTVDVDDSHPIVPGMPAFGRKVGSTSSQREQMRNHLAEQAKLAEQAQDTVTISDHGKQVGKQADVTEKEVPHGPAMPVKSFIEEMSAEPSYEKMVAAPTQAPTKEAPAKAAAPSFFLENPTASSHSLDKYA